MGNKKKIGSAFFVAILVFLAFATLPFATASPDDVIYVPDNYATIQKAVNAASTGDTIIARDGTYTDNINVNKQLTIRSENAYANCIVQAADTEDHVFEITADYVTIHGFTVKGATGTWKAGIYLSDYVEHCTISNNFVSNNRYGILPWYSNDNTISYNTLSGNYCGINLYSSRSSTITNNVFESDGILIMGWKLSHYNTHVIEDNTVNGKPIYYYKNTNGIKVPEDAGAVIIANCTDMTVENINASSGTVGIELGFTSNTEISGNNVKSNDYYGIYSAYSSGNTISSNDVSNNYCGISLWSSSNNCIYYNNLINNTDQANDNTGTNSWDNGYPSGGNFWNDYKDKYPGAEEIDESGIWDSPYDISGDAGAHDRYPLIDSWTEEQLPDLTLSTDDITFSNPNPVVGETVTITATIHNDGNADANNVLVQFVDNETQIESDQIISSIKSGGTGTAQVTWTTTFGSYNISIMVDPYDEIVEREETNNVAFRSITVSDSTDELKIIINEPSPYSAYPQGTNLTLNVTVYRHGKPLDANQTTVTAHLLGPADIERQILLEKRNNYNIGKFYLSFNYPKGFWSVRFEANDLEGNTASIETVILVTDTYLIQASTDRIAYTLNDTIFLMARVINVRPLKAMNDSDVNLTLSIRANNGTLLYEKPLVSDDDDNFKYNISAENLGMGSYKAKFDVVDREGNSVNKTITFAVTDDYYVTVNLDRNTYDVGTPVDVKGNVRFINGTGVANTPVELRIDIKGYFRLFAATTNETGGFSFLFEPFSHEAGNYTIEAKVTRDGLIRTDESNFTIHGLYMAPETASFRMTEKQSRTMNISLQNIGETELTGINVSLIDYNTSDDVTAKIRSEPLPSKLSPGEEAIFEVTVTSGQRSVREYELKLFNISATTDQDSNENTTINVNLYPLEPIVNVWPPDIEVGLRRNDTAIKTVTIMNTGFGCLENVTITQQPILSWVSLLSQENSVDLSPGENTSFDIYISPVNAEFGIYRQNITIKSDNYLNLTVNLTIHVTDLNNGSLFFHIDDIRGHNVNNATVSIITQSDLTEFKECTVITNDEGYALIDGLPIGRYTYWITPSDSVHFPQRGIVEVEPRFDPKVIELTLDMHFVEFSWDVIYTPLLDSYQLLLNFTFETDVPVPVLAAYPPMIYHEIEQNQTKSSSFRLMNHGIVSLFNVTLTQPVPKGGISLELQETDIGKIKAKKGVVVPYKVSATPDAPDCQVFRGDIEAVGDFIYFVDGKEKIGKAGTRIPYIIKTPCEPGQEEDGVPFPPFQPKLPGLIQCPDINVSPELITVDEKFGCTPEDTYQIIDPILVSNEDVEPVYFGPVIGYTNINTSDIHTPILKLFDEVDSIIFGFFEPDILGPGNDSIANLTDIPTTFPLPPELIYAAENISVEYNVSGYVAFAYGYDYPVCPHIIPVTGVRVFEMCPPGFVLPIPTNISIIMPDCAWRRGRGHEYYGNPPGPFIYTRHPRSPDHPSQPTVYGNTIHEIVKLSISQNATLERDAFTARLGIFNRMRMTNVTDVDIKLHFTDANGTDAEDMFYTASPHLRGIENINGSGIIGPLSVADMQWLIIPEIGAGGIDPDGIKYNISAEINYRVKGQNFSYRTPEAGITVKPQPNLTLTYYIPAEVCANKPFKFAIKVCNKGYGTARHFAIDSAQPEIYYNPSGLLVNFSLRNSSLDGRHMGTSLKIDFGDVYTAQCKFAWWEMVSTLDGDFTNFTGTYSHSDALGGRETALISNISTHIIQREIQTGNDTDISFDFLVGDEIDGIPKWVIDSMYGNDTEVVNVSYSIVMWDGTNLVIETQKVVDKWIVFSTKDPNDNKVPILKVVRHDINGTVEIPRFNYWMRNGRILIVDDPTEEYTITYGSISPVITNVTATKITPNSATITWDTNEPSDSSVKYGTELGNYTLQKYDPENVTSHSVNLIGLLPNTTFYFVVNSTDQSGNSNESSEHSFTTLKLLNVFDTGKGTYPSIMGTHNGTITPSHNITVNMMYTYPCAGTSGHSEYVRIWNSTLDVVARWDGYAGDWHNIYFDKTFVLYKDEIYNYTIQTGSYPQIIHKQSHITLDGCLITCSEFIDVNGKVYDDWIPAIRFFKMALFDTGPGTYPGIMGTHKGTIILSRNISVSRMYTYSCAGTGGHTESIEISENGTLLASGTWEGYGGDWHNLTIHNVSGAPYVMLLKGHKYNYSIVTGSYPQIIHTSSKEVAGGTIICSSFVDANGNVSYDCIPAIRLE